MNSRQSGKQRGEKAKDKKEGNNGGKEEEELWTNWVGKAKGEWGVGGRFEMQMS